MVTIRRSVDFMLFILSCPAAIMLNQNHYSSNFIIWSTNIDVMLKISTRDPDNVLSTYRTAEIFKMTFAKYQLTAGYELRTFSLNDTIV